MVWRGSGMKEKVEEREGDEEDGRRERIRRKRRMGRLEGDPT